MPMPPPPSRKKKHGPPSYPLSKEETSPPPRFFHQEGGTDWCRKRDGRGETPPPQFRWEKPPRGLFRLNWGVFWGGYFHLFWEGLITTSGGVAGGGRVLHFQGVFFFLFGGVLSPCSLFGGIFPPFCHFILKAPRLYRECYRTEATPFHPPLSQDLLSVCFMVQFRVGVVVSPRTLGWGVVTQQGGGVWPICL